MSTTDVFVEQVLIGLLVLAVVGMLALDEPEELLSSERGNWLTAALVIGVAYLIGIVYDRVGDTILEDREQYQRLLVAERMRERKIGDPSDWFPAGRLKKALFAVPEASAHGNYLRTRIRLTRALATLMPALTLAALMQAAGGDVSPELRRTFALILAGLYAIAIGARFVISLLKCRRIPKTWDAGSLTKLEKHRSRYALLDPAYGVLILWVILGAAVLIVSGIGRLWWVVGIGVLLTFLCGWVWWRITFTYHYHLADQQQSDDGNG
jgi:hypothetical protein